MSRFSRMFWTAGLGGLMVAGAAVTAPAASADEPQGDMEASISASSSLLLVSNVTFTGTLTNRGPDVVTGAQIEFVYSAGFTGQAPPGCSADVPNRIISCNFATTIPVNGSKSATIKLSVSPLTISTNLSVTARKSYSVEIDPNKTNDSDTVRCTQLTSLLVLC